MKQLASLSDPQDSQRYCQEIWLAVLSNLGVRTVSFYQPLGEVFLDAGLPQLAMEPFLLAKMVFEDGGADQAKEAANLLARAEQEVGEGAAQPRRKIEARLRKYLEKPGEEE